MSSFIQQDHLFMSRAIALARKGHYTTSPNPRVGCLIVKNGKVVGEGYHAKAGLGHAEVNALAQAKDKANGATVYVTLEPCSHFGRTPPCAQALIDADVAKVIVAMVDPNPKVSGKGLAMLDQAGIKTQSGLLEADARALNQGFVKLMTSGIPYIRCKLAASLDGKTAMENGESKWITSGAARQDVQRLRAQSCAVLSSAQSIISDDARMNVRWSELGFVQEQYKRSDLRQPVRVIIDTKNRLTPALAFFEECSPVILIRTSIENIHQWPHFVEQVQLPMAKNSQYVDLPLVLKMLAQRGLNDILLESGMSLAGAFVEQNLVDELILYQAPKLMGHDGNGLLAMPSIKQLIQAKNLIFSDVTLVGEDLKITATFE